MLADPPDADLHDPKSKQRVLAIRSRDLPEDYLLSVQQDIDASFTVLGPYTEVKQTEAENEILDALQDLMSGLEDGKYVTSSDIAEHLGKQRQSVKRALSRMQKAGRTTWKNFKILIKPGAKGGIRLS